MSLQTSDFYVSPLPKALIEKCRVMYDLYINSLQSDAALALLPQQQPQQQNTKVTTVNKKSFSKPTKDEMLPSTLAKLLEDLGVPTTENDARALIFSLSQNAALQISAEESVQRKRVIEHQLQQQQENDNTGENATTTSPNSKGNSKNNNNNNNNRRGRAPSIDQRSNSRRSSVSQSPRNHPTSFSSHQQNSNHHASSAVRLEAPPASAKLTLSFEKFVRVLQMPFNKSMREMEMQLLWNELDRDGDGVLSRSDIAQSIARMNGITSKGIPREVCESGSEEGRKGENNNQNSNNNEKPQQREGDDDQGEDEDDVMDNDSQNDALSVESSSSDCGDGLVTNQRSKSQHDDPHTSGRRKMIIRDEAGAATKTNRTALSKAFASASASKTNSNKRTASTTKNSVASVATKKASRTVSAKALTSTSQPSSSSVQQTSFDMLFQSPWMLEELSEHQLEALIHQLDSDGDGSVTFNDLKESLMNA